MSREGQGFYKTSYAINQVILLYHKPMMLTINCVGCKWISQLQNKNSIKCWAKLSVLSVLNKT